MGDRFYHLVTIGIIIVVFATAIYANPEKGIWISTAEVAKLPMSGAAWNQLKTEADQPASKPNLSNQDDATNVRVLAKALVFARTRNERYRTEVINACMAAMGTEKRGRTLALGRELAAYVIAADLVGLPPAEEQRFRAWLRSTLTLNLEGQTLRSTHELRPNNWGTHAGASRLAVAVYLGDQTELARGVQVFKGWLGDRSAYADFKFGDLHWQADPQKPVAINPKGAMKDGHPIDGVLPDDQRRAGKFHWPPPKENYVFEALQGALVQAVILSRQGYDVWNWQDQALRRAYAWLYAQAKFPARGDDGWQPYIINYYYHTEFSAPARSMPGKNVGWTDWTHAGRQVIAADTTQNAFQPQEFALEQNYPNPLSAAVRATQIAFEIKTAGPVSLELYNLMGQKIRTLFAGEAPAGRQVVAWNGTDGKNSRLPSGVYVYKLTSGQFTATKRLMLAR